MSLSISEFLNFSDQEIAVLCQEIQVIQDANGQNIRQNRLESAESRIIQI